MVELNIFFQGEGEVLLIGTMKNMKTVARVIKKSMNRSQETRVTVEVIQKVCKHAMKT